ncbi:MAG TPA: outer membrane beta-barrel protein [Azospirillum sp.]|nr:outer membrane beta-barrel protein [Azospirillum sp.]
MLLLLRAVIALAIAAAPAMAAAQSSLAPADPVAPDSATSPSAPTSEGTVIPSPQDTAAPRGGDQVTPPTRPEFTIGTALEGTDNVDLTPSSRKDSALIWTQTGRLRWVRLGTRLSGAIDAALDYDTIFGRDDGGVDHALRATGNARARAEVLEDLFFVDVQGLARRALLAPDAPISGLRAGGRGTTQLTSLSVSPFLAHRFGTYAEGELRYRFRQVFVGNSTIGNQQTHIASARLSTGSFLARQRHTLSAVAERTNAEVETNEVDRTTVLLDSEFAVTGAIAALTTVGWESVRSPALAEDPSGLVVMAGVRLRPTRESSVTVRAGRRYEKGVIDAEAYYEITPRLAVTGTYREGIQAPQQALTGVDLRYDPQLDTFVDEATKLPIERDDVGLGLATSVYRYRRFEAAVVGTYERDRIRVGGSYGWRDFDTGSDQTLWSATAQWSHRLTRRLGASVSATYRGSDSGGTTGRSDTVVVGIGADYQLTEKAYLLASLRRAQRWADREDAGYVENAIVVGLQVKF